MAMIDGITIVDREPLEDGDDDDEVADDDSDSDSRRRYFGPNRQVTKYIPSVSGAEFVVKVSLSLSRIQRLKSKALLIELSID